MGGYNSKPRNDIDPYGVRRDDIPGLKKLIEEAEKVARDDAASLPAK